MPSVGVGDRYRTTRLRLAGYLGELDGAQWATNVAACPGWRVRDVLAHLVGVVEDAVAGRLDGPPPPAQTAIEVERHSNDEPAALLEQWATLAPLFEPVITERKVWPALIDVLSHEHDIRGALGSQEHRDHPDLLRVARLLAAGLPDELVVDLGTDSPPEDDRGESARLVLHTTPFELVRLRLGRRSRAQVRRLDWSGDPEPVLDRLFIFGPATVDIVE